MGVVITGCELGLRFWGGGLVTWWYHFHNHQDILTQMANHTLPMQQSETLTTWLFIPIHNSLEATLVIVYFISKFKKLYNEVNVDI